MSSNRKNNRTKKRRMKRKRFLIKKRGDDIKKELFDLLPDTVEGHSRLPLNMTEGWYKIDHDETPVVEKNFFNFFRVFQYVF